MLVNKIENHIENQAWFGRITPNSETMLVNLYKYESLFKINIILLLADINFFDCKQSFQEAANIELAEKCYFLSESLSTENR